MLHLGFTWDLSPDKILLDRELDTNQLDWKQGDVFKFVNIDGRQMLVKIDPSAKFVKEYHD
jgi:hypothetical protein